MNNRSLFTEDGSLLKVAAQDFGKGGEGSIHAIEGQIDLCAKLYFEKELNEERHLKIQAMLLRPPDDPTIRTALKHHSIAWPLRVLYQDKALRQFVGFVMPRIDFKAYHSAVKFLDREGRIRVAGGGITWFHLYTMAMNMASAAAALHDRGYCIGDVNDENVLVGGNALVTFVDCDSFQVPDTRSGRVFRSPKRRGEYAPPEFQGVDYGQVDGTKESDCFSLAVLIFQFLMEGTHPYQARGKLVDDAGTSAAKIKLGHFPYGRSLRGVAPPDHAPPFEMLHPDIQRLFLRAFADGNRDPSARPNASEWFAVLKGLGRLIMECPQNKSHRFFSHLNRCPWCVWTEDTGKEDKYPSPHGYQVALADPSKPLESESQWKAFLTAYIQMALADGVLAEDERDYILAKAADMAIPKKFAEKTIDAVMQRTGAKHAPSASSSKQSGTPPVMEIAPTSFSYSDLRVGVKAQGRFMVTNTNANVVGSRPLSGPIRSNQTWLTVSRSQLDTGVHQQEVEFEVNTAGLQSGTHKATIEINSNVGRESIAVSIDIEMPEAAINRFRLALVPISAFVGAFVGDTMRRWVGYDGIPLGIGTMVSCLVSSSLIAWKTAVKTGNWFFVLLGGGGALVLSWILEASMGPIPLLSGLLYGIYGFAIAGPVLMGLQRKDKFVYELGIAGAVLVAALIAGGLHVLKADDAASRARMEQIQKQLPGEWRCKVGDSNGTLTIAGSGGNIQYQNVEEQLDIQVQSSGEIVLRGTGYRRLRGKGKFALDAFSGALSADGRSLQGKYKDRAGNRGSWQATKVEQPPPPKVEPSPSGQRTSRPAPHRDARVVLNSTPVGATVIIDRTITRTTPVTLTLKSGDHGVEVRHSGCSTKWDVITADLDVTRHYTFALENCR